MSSLSYLHSASFISCHYRQFMVCLLWIPSPIYVFMSCLNSLAPGKFEWNFRHVIFKQILVIDGWSISCQIALIWMSLDITDDQSTLVQVMAWCHQATSHYLSQCWPRSMSPNGVIRPQWVMLLLCCTQYHYGLYCKLSQDLFVNITISIHGIEK